ncbi:MULTISPECIES: response regulator transcription factor [Prochlorococcus]|uniref:Two-component response regulator, CheY-like receiver and wHTH DNA-binding domains n=1 Tax=Prochlorococcus marinus (strain SARG / CCMP1375 / SS120) TaxID=167539 RepID=Q7VAC2_PROMA|nr:MULTISPECIES: response regulator transcription factor [Prochlorococcus]AAQ00586.1 Two-component response regulator, CheY-like receiver and wHTH DNA-binding domains [Prochlorococcus marinus subsp. marinus str. CCMP1375]
MLLDVLVVEDDFILLDFLYQELSNQINSLGGIVRKASSLDDARKLISQKSPDWILVDLLLPDGSGIELAEEFILNKPNSKVLILTAQADQYVLPATLLKNVHALINKADGLAPLREAVWEILKEVDSTFPELNSLTPRQMEFLHLIGKGLDTAQIAKKLDVSFSTAQTHRRQITRKLKIKGSALVTFAKTLPKSL